MYTVYDENRVTDICFDPFENPCIEKALKDIRKDICRVGGGKAKLIPYLPGDIKGKLIVGTLKNERFERFVRNQGIELSEIRHKWENYVIRTVGEDNDTVIIAGSDERGTMWGIYEFSRCFLDMDPLYLWTDFTPEKKKNVRLPKTNIVDGPRSFRFRGWFINDEDLLEGFSKGGPQEKGYDFHKDYDTALGMLIETALRMKQNLLIPCSHLDIENPDEENLVRMITERGLYISMHHQEPVGVHQFTADRYWKERGIEDINYFEYREEYEQLWRRYIKKWSQYENVIWQLGLRGRGDRPVWYNATGIPTSIQDRGKLISDAIQKQMDIIMEENQGKDILSSSTLWMEGMELYHENVLRFPEGTKVIFADFAPEQMWGEGYYTAPREAKRDYGLYYHVGFWGCGPHLIQGNSPDKIYYNYRNAVNKGDNDYSILNVANFREFVYNIKCVADITWNIDGFETEQYCLDWCQKEFKGENSSELAEIYKEYFKCFYEMDTALIPGQMLLMDGMLRRVALKLIEIIKGSELRKPDIQNKRLFDFQTVDDFIQYYENAAKEGISRFKKLYCKAIPAVSTITKDRQPFFVSNMIVQIEIALGLYSWVYYLCLAAENRRSIGDNTTYQFYLNEAEFALSKIIMDRRKAAISKWEHWYDGDSLMNIEESLELTRQLHY